MELLPYFLVGCCILVFFQICDATPVSTSKLSFDIPDEWNLIPDFNGRFHLMNRREIDVVELRPFFDPDVDVSFHLFTRLNPTEPQIFNWNNLDEILNSNFNSSHPTRFTIHGWTSSPAGNINTRIRDAFLEFGDFNVMVVDWESVAAGNYISVRNLVPQVGAALARTLEYLSDAKLIAFSNVSLIGHSLGAHVAGLAGKNITSDKVNTIIGMDPAGVLFSVANVNGRLDKSDANYVEVIHTDRQSGFGDPIGHADFYPNGGETQPGCADASCSHSRAHALFAETIITPVGFWAGQCADLTEIRNNICTVVGPAVPMGGEPSNYGRAEGLYYLDTNGVSPFARGPRET